MSAVPDWVYDGEEYMVAEVLPLPSPEEILLSEIAQIVFDNPPDALDLIRAAVKEEADAAREPAHRA